MMDCNHPVFHSLLFKLRLNREQEQLVLDHLIAAYNAGQTDMYHKIQSFCFYNRPNDWIDLFRA